jgi:hypothetical protein
MEDEKRIQEILAGLAQPTQKPGIAQSLLSAIPQAISVLFSKDPSATLQNQLNQRQEQAERERERQQRIQQLGSQLRIEDILQRGRERREEERAIRTEGRGFEREKESARLAEERDVRDFARRSGFQEKLVDKEFENTRKLKEIDQEFQVENQKTQFINQKELENLRSSNNRLEQRIGAELSFTLPLMYSKYFSGKDSGAIYDKLSRGETLTAEERSKITRANEGVKTEAFNRERQLIHERSRGTGSIENITAKATQWAQSRACHRYS